MDIDILCRLSAIFSRGGQGLFDVINIITHGNPPTTTEEWEALIAEYKDLPF